MVNTTTSIPKDKIKTMQKDIRAAKTNKIDLRAPILQKTTNPQESIKKEILPNLPEQLKDFKMPPVTQKIPQAVPMQKPEAIQMPKINQEQQKADIIQNNINQIKENKVNEPEKTDTYREPIE